MTSKYVTMVNSADFAKRLQQIMAYYKLSAASFADKINVQRSSISHILSGRNKPSLDFVMKVVKTFDEVELYWLLNGKGSFPSSYTPPALPQDDQTILPEEIIPKQVSKAAKQIERIVIFYNDGTFKEYNKQ